MAQVMVTACFLPGGMVISNDMESLYICSMQTLCWCPTRLSAWPSSIFNIYQWGYQRGHILTLLFLSWLCLRHSSHRVLLPFRNSSSNSDLNMCDEHLTMNEWQSWSYWGAVCPCRCIPTSISTWKTLKITSYDDAWKHFPLLIHHSGACSALCHLKVREITIRLLKQMQPVLPLHPIAMSPSQPSCNCLHQV